MTTGGPNKRAARGPEHELLIRLVGRWTITGRNGAEAPSAPNAPIAGEESYEWLPGEFFVLGRWDRRIGDGRHVGVSMLGRAVDASRYEAHNFDNLGYARRYVLSASGSTLTFSGEWERATYEIAEDGRSFRARWEISKDGSTWGSLCELRGERR